MGIIIIILKKGQIIIGTRRGRRPKDPIRRVALGPASSPGFDFNVLPKLSFEKFSNVLFLPVPGSIAKAPNLGTRFWAAPLAIH